MFEYQPSRHPLQTFQFWFAVLICAGGVSLWRFGGIQKSDTPEVMAEVAAEYSEELPPPPLSEVDLGESFAMVDLTSPPQQSEEVLLPQLTSEIKLSPEGSAYDSINGSAKPFPSFNSPREESLPPQTELSASEQSIQRLSTDSATTHSPVRTAYLNRMQESQKNSLPTLGSQQPVNSSGINLDEIDQMMAGGEDVLALRKLSTIYWESPTERPVIRSRLNDLSRRIYFQPQPHYMEAYDVQFGDRLELIARKYQVPWQYLAKMNRIDAQRLRAGKKLKVIQGPFNVVVDLTKFEATVHAHGYYVVRMPVGIGKDGATPIGTFRVTDKVEDPIYYGPDGVIKNDDPLNPLGERWIAISDENNTLQGYGLHGTIDPDSIGKSESRGCVRFHDQDIADLYDLLTIGSEVVIRR